MMNQVLLESSDHFPFLMELLEVLHQFHGGRWGRQRRYCIFAFLIYSWENPYNFLRNGAIDSNRVFLGSPGHVSFPMGLVEVPQCLLVGRWGPPKSMPYFLISNLFWVNSYKFAINGATDSNRVFLESSNHFPFLMELLAVLH